MNIIVARMPGYDWVSTPMDAVVRELRKLGHKLTVVDDPTYIPIGNYDFVFSAYESTTLLGDYISSKLNIPHFAHIEVLPPWRVIDNCDYKNYGLSDQDQEVLNFKNSKPHYIKVGEAWKRAAIRTVSNPVRVPMHQQLLPGIGKIDIRYPSIDVRTIEIVKKNYNPQRIPNRVITISRCVPIKRYDLLVETMNKVKTKCEWLIVGDGPYKDVIKQNLTNENVTTIFASAWGIEKIYLLLTSSVMVYAMGAMPPVEAALCGVHPIIIENQGTRDIPEFDKFMYNNFGGYVPRFLYNQSDEMADLVDQQLNNKVNLLKDYNIVENFLNNKMGVTSSEQNAKNIVSLVESCIK